MNNFEITTEIKNKFNWGAFFLGWIWGLFNKSYITLLQIPIAFIPFIGPVINIGLAVWFGKKGNEWALKNKHFNNLEEFIKFQNNFIRAFIYISLPALIILCLYFKYIAFGITSIYSLFFDICAKVLVLLLIILSIVSLNIKKSFKIISLIILITCSLIIFNLNNILHYYSVSLYNNDRYEDAIKVIKFMIKNTTNPVEKDCYREAIAQAYLKNKDLDSAIFYFESISDDKFERYRNMDLLNDLYILTDNKIKIDEKFLKYRVCFMNEDWACVVAETTRKLNHAESTILYSSSNKKDMSSLDGKVLFSNDRENLYLSRAIAYKKLGNSNLAKNDLKNALKICYRKEQDKYIKIYNDDTDNYWKTYYNNLKQQYGLK